MGQRKPNTSISLCGGRHTDAPLTCVDLFCGCGGFSLGMLRAGIEVLAAIDFNPEAVATCRKNLAARIPHILEKDLTKFGPVDLDALLEGRAVDLIVGGPPCQGFSSARQRDGANHGEKRFVEDARRQLYKEFLRYVEFFQPRMFVMENVLGIRSAAGGEYFTRVLHEGRSLGRQDGRPGYRVQSQIEDAHKLGVPQKRRRQLFIGVRADLPGFFPPEEPPAPRAIPFTKLESALAGLPRLKAGGGTHRRPYSNGLVEKMEAADPITRNYLKHVLEIEVAQELTGHVARPHSERDLRDFRRLREGESSAVAMRNGVEFEFTYNKTVFKDRYTRQSRKAPCSTIVAHLSKDGLMFIHPTQNRTLTPREAARIQSFPDWFEFPEARTHAYRLIGNAVPPLVSEAVGFAVVEFLKGSELIEQTSLHAKAKRKETDMNRNSVPTSDLEAAQVLESVLEYSEAKWMSLEKNRFLECWNAVFFLYSGLHPDEADHGNETCEDIPQYHLVRKVDKRLFSPFFIRSGWPQSLVPLLNEAWRRYRTGGLADHEIYPHTAQMAGIAWREGQ